LAVNDPAQNDDLHGNVPDDSPVVLMLIDVIGDFEFASGERLLTQALPMAERLAELKRRAKALGIAAVYANDNYGRWRSDFKTLVQHALAEDARGRPVAQLLRPDDDDYFVLKPKHSGFYATSLDILLHYLKAKTLIITGLAADKCVFFTAGDAFMRDYRLYVPADCTASQDPDDHCRVLRQMHHLVHADITPSTNLDLERLIRESGE
jgi:nicotinamidase-related amidase